MCVLGIPGSTHSCLSAKILDYYCARVRQRPHYCTAFLGHVVRDTSMLTDHVMKQSFYQYKNISGTKIGRVYGTLELLLCIVQF